MLKHYRKVVKFFYFNKQGKKIIYEVWDKDSRDFMISLLESSHKDDIGDIYTIDSEGNEKVLDYYND